MRDGEIKEPCEGQTALPDYAVPGHENAAKLFCPRV